MRWVLLALLADVVAVLVFAVLGRGQHGLAESVSGAFATAWPFLSGLVISWLAALVWHRPAAPLRSGVPVWLGTVGIGLLLRVWFTDGGAAPAFILVALGFLALLLVGWRLIAVLVTRVKRRQ